MERDNQMLVKIARQSINFGLENGMPGKVRTNKIPVSLLEPGACFVTLMLENKLRGCIGSVKPHRALAQDVATNAYMAAFQDRRFKPLTKDELEQVHIDVSVLTEPVPIDCDTEEELLEIIRPEIDGLIIQDNEYRGVFLPAVWRTIPQKESFLKELKLKAGLAADYWSDNILCWRFTTKVIKEQR